MKTIKLSTASRTLAEYAAELSDRNSFGPLQAHDRRLVALSGARVVTIGDERSPDWLE